MLEYESADVRLYGLGLANTALGSAEQASSAIGQLMGAMNVYTREQASVAAVSSRLEYTLSSHRNYITHAQQADSIIRDTDVAKEAAAMSRAQVRLAAATSILSRHNQLSQNVLTLLTG